MRSASEVDAAHRVDRERHHLIDVALHEPFEAVANANDVEAFEAAERHGGYGGLKMTGDPLPQCQFKIEPAYEGDGPDFECVNPRFFDCTDAGSEGLRVFDLRDALA